MVKRSSIVGTVPRNGSSGRYPHGPLILRISRTPTGTLSSLRDDVRCCAPLFFCVLFFFASVFSAFLPGWCIVGTCGVQAPGRKELFRSGAGYSAPRQKFTVPVLQVPPEMLDRFEVPTPNDLVRGCWLECGTPLLVVSPPESSADRRRVLQLSEHPCCRIDVASSRYR